MHTAKQLAAAQFTVELDGRAAGIADLLPDWRAHDRLGVVIAGPFEALGVSHLIQCAITAFYDAVPARREADAQYPDNYLFHVGGRWGDHSMFDFWPPRKEVSVELDPAALLRALNDRAITRLAVVERDGAPGPGDGAVEWEELTQARTRIVSAFAFSPSGRTAGADVRIAGLVPETELNPSLTLDCERVVAWARSQPAASVPAHAPGDPAAAHRARIEQSMQAGLARYLARVGEVPRTTRTRLAAERAALRRDGVVVESCRRVPVDEALRMLWPACAPRSDTAA